ncbi:MAG: hypothetical protein EHM47_09845 [Ignavibacteriales bacterium]|nr:MAG: hypothetical protein EHM47_09845 [Ignavibacteriales bacterium]
MGQQQLLLIVLGVIIVGIAVVVGINLFNANAETSTQDSIVSQGTNIGAMAQQYYKKPVSMGGGGNTWTDGPNSTDFGDYFDNLPADLTSSADADWVVTTLSDSQLVLTASPKEASYTWDVITTVTPTSIQSIVQ